MLEVAEERPHLLRREPRAPGHLARAWRRARCWPSSGRNGMGKTTLIRSIVGFTPPRRGPRALQGHATSPAGPRTGWSSWAWRWCPQGRRVFPSLTVRENLEVARAAAPGAGALERVYALFPRLARAGAQPRQQALGRRAADAGDRPGAHDQPRPAADGRADGGPGAAARARGRAGHRASSSASGLSILLVEQNLPLALSVADRVHVLSRGQIVHSGPPAELLANEDVKSRYLGCEEASMRFGTYYFFQAPPGHRHADIIRARARPDGVDGGAGLRRDLAHRAPLHRLRPLGGSGHPRLRGRLAHRAGSASAWPPPSCPSTIRSGWPSRWRWWTSSRRAGSTSGSDAATGPSEFRGYRMPQEESRERFDEAVEIMRARVDRGALQLRRPLLPGARDVRVIPKPMQQPHPPLYQVCVTPDGIESTALRGWPMLNSSSSAPSSSSWPAATRYVATLQKAGRSPAGDRGAALPLGRLAPDLRGAHRRAGARRGQGRRDVVPGVVPEVRHPRADRGRHPTLQPGFRAMAERLSKITWEGLVAETLAFGSPDTVARHIEEMRQMGVGQVMCWMNFGGLPAGQGAPLHGALRPRGHAPL